MKTFLVQDATGHSTLTFDDMAAAENKFGDLLKAKMLAYKRTPSGGHVQIRSFQETDDETLFAIPLIGG